MSTTILNSSRVNYALNEEWGHKSLQRSSTLAAVALHFPFCTSSHWYNFCFFAIIGSLFISKHHSSSVDTTIVYYLAAAVTNLTFPTSDSKTGKMTENVAYNYWLSGSWKVEFFQFLHFRVICTFWHFALWVDHLFLAMSHLAHVSFVIHSLSVVSFFSVYVICTFRLFLSFALFVFLILSFGYCFL